MIKRAHILTNSVIVSSLVFPTIAFTQEISKPAPKPPEVLEWQKIKPSLYSIFQYRDSNKTGSEQTSFSNRSTRVGFTYAGTDSLSFRLSYEFVTGSSLSNSQLRDAFLAYEPTKLSDENGLIFRVGQFSLDLGYELRRSDADRETAGRSLFFQRYFSGERSQGVQGMVNLGNGYIGGLSLTNSLTTSDFEQANLAPNASDRKLAISGSLRRTIGKANLGLSGFSGSRPSFKYGTTTIFNAPTITRNFLIVDATFVGALDPNFTLRGEFYVGKDRNDLGRTPTTLPANYSATSVKGWQIQGLYKLDKKTTLLTRFEELDAFDYQKGTSFGVLFDAASGLRLSGHLEFFGGNRTGTKYRVVTLRTQFKF